LCRILLSQFNATFYKLQNLSGIRLASISDILRQSTPCYGHKSSTGTVRRLFHQKSYNSTAPVRCPAGGRKNRTIFYYFLDIVRCPVNFRYYCTAFGRVIEGKITSAGRRTVPGRHPDGVFTHRTGTGRFLFNIYIVRFQRRPSGHRTVPAGHRTMSDKRQELSKIA